MQFSEIIDILLEANQPSNFSLYLNFINADGRPTRKVSQVAIDYAKHIASLLVSKELSEEQLEDFARLVGLAPEMKVIGFRKSPTFDTGFYEPPVTSTSPISGKYGNVKQNYDTKPKRVGQDTVLPFEALPTSMGYKAGEPGSFSRRAAAVFPSYYTKLGRIGQDEIPAKILPAQNKVIFGIKTESLRSSTEDRKEGVIAVGFGKIIKQSSDGPGASSKHTPGDPGISLGDVMQYLDKPKADEPKTESIIRESEGPMEQWAIDYLDKGHPYWLDYVTDTPIPADEILSREKYLTGMGKLPNPKRPKKLVQTAQALDKSLSSQEAPAPAPEQVPEEPEVPEDLELEPEDSETPEADAAYSTAEKNIILPLEPITSYNQEAKARIKILIFPEKFIDINYKLLKSGPVQHLRSTGKISIDAQNKDIWRIRNLTSKNVEIPSAMPIVQLKYGQVVYVDKDSFEQSLEFLKMYDLQVYDPNQKESRRDFDMRVRSSLWAAPEKINAGRFNREHEVLRKLTKLKSEYGIDFEVKKASNYNLGKVTKDKTETITYFILKFVKPYTEFEPSPDAVSTDSEVASAKKRKSSSLGEPVDMDSLDKALRDIGLGSKEEEKP